MASGPVAPGPVAPGPVAPRPAGPGPEGRRPRTVVVAAAVALLLVVVAAGVVLKLAADRRDPASGAAAGSPSAAAQALPGLPKVLAHRGGQETAPLQTLAAMTASAAAGYGVETDVRWTDDDVAVLLHESDGDHDLPCDPAHTVESTFYNVLLADCHARDAAGREYPLATMRQAAAAVAKNPAAQFFPEIKENQTATQTREYLAVLQEAGIAERSVATSFTLAELTKIGTRADAEGIRLRRMLFLQKGSTASASDIRGAGLFAVAISPELATRKYVTELHAMGLKVVVWTVNGPKGWQQAKDAGADTVLTDRPTAYLKWL